LAQKAEFELSLKDLFSSGLDKASGKVKDFEGGINHAKETVGELAKAFGLAFGVEKIAEFFKGSVEKFMEQEKASKQLEAVLRSTGSAAGMTAEGIDKLAQSQAQLTLYEDDATVESAKLLLSFTNIKKGIFEEAIPAIANMASFMGTDLQGATMQVGKALNDPIKGIAALSRAGVSFSEGQKEVIKKMTETGNIAGAQKLIMNELTKEFGGAAAAAREADPFGALTIQFGEFQETVGKGLVSVIKMVMPTLKTIVEGLQTFVDYLGEHTWIIKSFGLAIGILGAAFLAAKLEMVAMSVVAAVTMVPAIITTIAQIGLMNTAMLTLNATLLLNPLVLLGVGLAASAVYLVKKIDDLGKANDKLKESMYGLNKEAETETFNIEAEFNEKKLGKSLQAQKYAANQLKAEALRFKVDELNQAMGAEMAGNKKMAEHHRNLAAKQDKRAAFFGELAAEKQKGIIDETTTNFANASKKAENKLDSAVGKVEGTRMTNLNISIEKLIEKFEINTTNVSESVERIREEVSKALLEAVNDVNIIAGQ
tara:strand:+ start:1308 stop:2924 length:1617 start_codon:yes stop_codon:yes gene_type:complete